MADVVAVVKDVAVVLTPILVTALAMMEWRAKLGGSKELTEVRKELLDVKEERVKIVKERVETVKAELDFSKRLVSRSLWDDHLNQKAQMESRIEELREEEEKAATLDEEVRRLKEELEDLPGRSALEAERKLAEKTIHLLEEQQ